MGNCVFRGFGGVEDMIKVVTSNGGLMELYAPVTAECITNEFPGHALFRSRDLFSKPLLHNEELHVGELYHLLPLTTTTTTTTRATNKADHTRHHDYDDDSNSNNLNISTSSMITPYRMSCDNQGVLKRSDAEVFPRYNSTGVWKVKLVISPEQLSEILSQEARTEALIESVRTVAKCGSAAPSVANSDQWSLSSSWKASSDQKYSSGTES